MEPEPKVLHKYRSLSGDSLGFTRNIFMKNELYFPHPDEINDPFDCKNLPCLETLTKEMLIEHFGKMDPEELKEKGMDLSKLKENITNTPLTDIRDRLERELPRGQGDVGVLCLSEKYLDTLMWGHYADSHKGICLGFDYYELSFTFREEPILPEQVIYPEDNKYPKWNPFDGRVMTQFDDVEDKIKKIYFTKSIDWKYEREWRVILPTQGRTLQKIKPDALVSVYLGCQIAKCDKETVISWCLQRERKPKVYQMTKDKTSYSLKENEISY